MDRDGWGEVGSRFFGGGDFDTDLGSRQGIAIVGFLEVNPSKQTVMILFRLFM